MWKALEVHEQGHALIYAEGILKLEFTLSGIAEGTITVAELSTHLSNAMAKMEEAQDKFERTRTRVASAALSSTRRASVCESLASLRLRWRRLDRPSPWGVAPMESR